MSCRKDFHASIRLGFTAAAIAATLLTGCSNRQRLPEYNFQDRTVSIVAVAPTRPEVLRGFNLPAGNNPVDRVIAIGSAVLLETSARQAQVRLDSAGAVVNVRDRMSARVLEGAARQLRAVPVGSSTDADFEIEVRIYRYGITASNWSSNAEFLLDAELFLLDGITGRRIWKERVRETEPLRPYLSSGDRAVNDVVSAVALSNMSTAEIQRQLEALADFSADRLVLALARAMDEVRG